MSSLQAFADTSRQSNELFALDTSRMTLREGGTYELGSYSIAINSVILSTIDVSCRTVVEFTSCRFGRASIVVPDQLFDFILGTFVGEGNAVVPQAMPLLFEAALSGFLETLEASHDFQLAVTAIRKDRQAVFTALAAPNPRAVNVHISDKQLSCPVVILAPPELQNMFDEWAGQQMPMRFRDLGHLADLPVLADVNISAIDVSPSLITAIEVGDVLKLPKTDNGPGRVARLRLGNRLFATGRIVQNSALVIESVVTVETETTPLHSAERWGRFPGWPERDMAPGAPECALDVDIGYVQVPAAALRHLAEGDVLELRSAHADQVLLKCDGKLIAKGDLIELGSAQGVLIDSVY